MTSLTKKNYEAIASIIKSTHNNARLYNQPQRLDTLEVTASRLADYFATDNKNFNREMFLQACGIGSCRACGGKCKEHYCDNIPT